MELARKSFTSADQAAFAHISGDRNPMHMDVNAARRTQMGAPVVHGVNGVLWALDAASDEQIESISSLKVNFPGPIYTGDTAVTSLVGRTETQVRLQVRVENAPATVITLQTGDLRTASAPLNNAPPMDAAWPTQPLPMNFEQLAGQAGAFNFARPFDEVARFYPKLARRISPRRTAALAALSRVVGMTCPGLHSIFSGFTVNFVEGGENLLRYRVVETDPRFRIVRIAIAGGGIEGELTAIARVPPVQQPTMAEIAALTPTGAYAGAVVLVVGGSRGLGEVTAKTCAAGGARVIVTYANGRDEAELVANDIRAHGGVCETIRLDVREEIATQLADLAGPTSHLYYYATGPIAQRRTRFLSEDVLANFMRFYTTGFAELCEAILTRNQGTPLRVFYPSSVAVSDTPKGWAEYALAKAAGELLCRELNAKLAGVAVTSIRLPRILTDQTATARAVESFPVLDVIMPIVRDLQAD